MALKNDIMILVEKITIDENIPIENKQKENVSIKKILTVCFKFHFSD